MSSVDPLVKAERQIGVLGRQRCQVLAQITKPFRRVQWDGGGRSAWARGCIRGCLLLLVFFGFARAIPPHLRCSTYVFCFAARRDGSVSLRPCLNEKTKKQRQRKTNIPEAMAFSEFVYLRPKKQIGGKQSMPIIRCDARSDLGAVMKLMMLWGPRNCARLVAAACAAAGGVAAGWTAACGQSTGGFWPIVLAHAVPTHL